MEGFFALGLAITTFLWGAWRDYHNKKANEANQRAVAALEEGKLDLSVATLGHDILMDVIEPLRVEVRELRAEVDACHEERDDFRYLLVVNGLLPKPGTE